MIRLEPLVPEAVLAAVRAPFLAREAIAVDTPVMQPLALLLDLSGEAMRARLFVVQADGIDEACLRPDFTMPVAMAHIAAGAGEAAYRYEGKAFVASPVGADRSEEFLQIGIEVLGGRGPKAADAELLVLAWRGAMAAGRGDLHVELGDLSLFSAFVEALGLAPSLTARLKRAFHRPRSLKAELERAQTTESVTPEVDHPARFLSAMPEADAVVALEEMWAKAGAEPVGGRGAAEIVRRLADRARDRAAPRLTAAQADMIGRFLAIADAPSAALQAVEELAREAGADLETQINDWGSRLAMLGEAGVPESMMRLSPAFGRAFGYYDGFLFEVRSAALGPDQPVAAGGRYDSLLAKLAALSGKSAPEGGAAGCMVRPWRAWAGAN